MPFPAPPSNNIKMPALIKNSLPVLGTEFDTAIRYPSLSFVILRYPSLSFVILRREACREEMFGYNICSSVNPFT